MSKFALTGKALAIASAIALIALPVLSARADDDDHGWRHDNGRHLGWYKHRRDEEPRVYYPPGSVYVAPPPPVYVAPPAIVYAPPPVYVPPASLNLVVPLNLR